MGHSRNTYYIFFMCANTLGPNICTFVHKNSQNWSDPPPTELQNICSLHKSGGNLTSWRAQKIKLRNNGNKEIGAPKKRTRTSCSSVCLDQQLYTLLHSLHSYKFFQPAASGVLSSPLLSPFSVTMVVPWWWKK